MRYKTPKSRPNFLHYRLSMSPLPLRTGCPNHTSVAMAALDNLYSIKILLNKYYNICFRYLIPQLQFVFVTELLNYNLFRYCFLITRRKCTCRRRDGFGWKTCEVFLQSHMTISWQFHDNSMTISWQILWQFLRQKTKIANLKDIKSRLSQQGEVYTSR